MIADRTEHVLSAVDAAIGSSELRRAETLLAELVEDPAWWERATPAQACRVAIDWAWLHGATAPDFGTRAQRYETARTWFARASALAREAGDPSLEAEALREAGIVERYDNQLTRAEELFAESARVGMASGDPLAAGQGRMLQASVAQLAGRHARARICLAQARGFAETCAPGANRTLLLADIARYQAVSARVARDLDAARELLSEARDHYSSIGRHIGQANTEQELGALAEQLGNVAAARTHYSRAFVAFLRGARPGGAANAARRIGHLDLTTGNLDAAERRFQQAARLGAGEVVNLGLSLLFRSQVARLRGRYDRVEELLGEAVALYSRQDDNARNLSQVAFEYGRVARDRGDAQAAIHWFREALRALQGIDDPGAEALARYHLATELVRQDHIAEAAEHALASFHLNEKAGVQLRVAGDRRAFYVRHRETYTLAVHCAARAGDGLSALQVATSARAEALAAFVRRSLQLSPRLRDLVNTITVSAASLDSPDGPGSPDPHVELADLYRQLERQTSAEMRQALDGPPDITAVLETVPGDAYVLLLEILEEDDRLCQRIWVPPGGEPQADEVVLPEPAWRLLNGYRRAERDIAWRRQTRQLESAGDALIPASLADRLMASPVPPPLIISSASALATMPVAALRVHGRYLVHLAQPVLVPSLSLWAAVRNRARHAGHGCLVFTDPSLRGAPTEAKAAARAFPPAEHVDVAQLRARLSEARHYQAVCLTAHGSVPQPTASAGTDEMLAEADTGLAQYLHLSTGERLTAAQLLTCRVPELFVMASCWAGRLSAVAAVEPFGLPSAALVAGARCVLAGSVDIGSASSGTILARFYGYVADGLPPAEALRRAQLSYIRRHPFSPPGRWAGLNIVGDGLTSLCPRPTASADAV